MVHLLQIFSHNPIDPQRVRGVREHEIAGLGELGDVILCLHCFDVVLMFRDAIVEALFPSETTPPYRPVLSFADLERGMLDDRMRLLLYN